MNFFQQFTVFDFSFIGLTSAGVIYLHLLRCQNKKHNIMRLKYQRHLRNVFDYQLQMYAFMADNDAEGFKLASDQVSEELSKCEQILKEK